MMRFLFVKSNKPMSKLIMWVLNEPVSHFAIYFPSHKSVFHSSTSGVRAILDKDFFQQYEIVFELTCDNGLSVDGIFSKISKCYMGKAYDYGAFLFFLPIILAKKMFKYSYKRNLWSKRNKYLCTELVEVIKLNLSLDIEWPERLDTITPYQLYLIMSQSKKLQ